MSIVTFCSSDPHRRQLRSSTVRSAMVSRTRTQFGRRAFIFSLWTGHLEQSTY